MKSGALKSIKYHTRALKALKSGALKSIKEYYRAFKWSIEEHSRAFWSIIEH